MTEKARRMDELSTATTVAGIMNKDVVAIDSNQSICEAAKLLAKNKISSVVITDGDEPVGIVTETDLVRKVIGQDNQDSQTNISQIMSSELITASQDLSLIEAGKLMHEKSIKRLVITDQQQILGIVTQTDILKAARKVLEAQAETAKQQLRQANIKLGKIADDAGNAAREAVLSDLTGNHFIASMSHEIRTPLNAIIGLSEVLAEEGLSGDQANHIAIIRESAQNTLVLINDILDFSKIEAGKFDVQFEECSLEHLIAVIESLMRPRAMQKDLNFGIFPRGELPALIKTDNMRLRQCLINLINNAIEFTDKGHVYLNIRLEEVDGQPYVRFDVEDTGIGIASENQKKIFEQFTQADTLKNRRCRGSGLGLTITNKLVNLLGGSVIVISKVNIGSTFSLLIPAGVDVKAQPVFNKQDQLSKLQIEQKTLQQRTFSGRVLVAEDTPTNQILIKLLLEKMGFEVTITPDGREALEAALSQDFDIVLMDIQMPNMNGYDATKQLREKGFTKPIVAVTAHAMKGDREKCLAAGCDDYLPKPINRDKLIRTIAKYLSPETDSVVNKVEAVTAQVEQLTQMCSSAGDPLPKSSKSNDALPADDLVDSESIKNICDDETVVKQVVEMFLKDSPQCIKSLAESIKSANPKHIRMYAHSLKGASLQIGAKKLSAVAYKLECAGRDKDMEHVPAMFTELQDEYSKLALFLSQPNWIDLVKNKQA